MASFGSKNGFGILLMVEEKPKEVCRVTHESDMSLQCECVSGFTGSQPPPFAHPRVAPSGRGEQLRPTRTPTSLGHRSIVCPFLEWFVHSQLHEASHVLQPSELIGAESNSVSASVSASERTSPDSGQGPSPASQGSGLTGHPPAAAPSPAQPQRTLTVCELRPVFPHHRAPRSGPAHSSPRPSGRLSGSNPTPSSIKSL